MMDADRVLRPLYEAGPAIDRLDTYESPAVLTEALRATWHAVERTLRLLLRGDASAPDEIRMSALSPEQMPFDTVMLELRRRDLITIRMAGRVHELQQVVQRSEHGTVRAADADGARDVVHALTVEVRAVAARGDATVGDVASKRDVSEPRDVRTPRVVSASRDVPASRDVSASRDVAQPGVLSDARDASGRPLARGPRRPLYMAALALVLLAGMFVLINVLGGRSEMELGIAAFTDGRAGVAEQHFRAVLEGDGDNVTARLYLARILRTQGRTQEAADVLRAAARLAPMDATVRRELGYLFLDLNSPQSAVEQLRRAVELQPDEPLNWVGLVQALRRAGDPAADEWLRRAPAEARALIGTQ